MIERAFARGNDHMRPVTIERDFLARAAGSCLIEVGGTQVLCAATIEENVPGWLVGKGRGWVTAEYSLLPASTHRRTRRERNGARGRTAEIERLIGRSLRTVTDLTGLGGEVQIIVDCDVLQADGGTRTASITGAWVALADALAQWRAAGKIASIPLTGQVAATSVGIVDGELLLDLDYAEDSRAEVDMNVVCDAEGRFIELQGTGERVAFTRTQMDSLLDLASGGIGQLLAQQQEALA
jgi:ribonuclease PH